MDAIVLTSAVVVLLVGGVLAFLGLRRWARNGFRYRIRTMLIGFTGVALLLFSWMQWAWPILRHRRAVENIRAAGGWILFNDKAARDGGYEAWERAQGNAWLDVVEVRLNSDAGVDAAANDLESFSTLVQLSLTSGVTDATMHRLADLEPPLKLRTVQLFFTHITDVEPFTHFESVEYLFINTATLTDDGLQALPKVPGLKRLFMCEEQPSSNPLRYTERGFEAIGKIPDLHSLTLIRYRITIPSAKSLQGLQGLEKLHLRGCTIEDEAIVELRAALPNCEITIPECHPPTPQPVTGP